ncbi:MAG: S9 family peptidase [Anaerolineae bacterium]|nr:S9 family peptidase [Anaerolineae bacterium]
MTDNTPYQWTPEKQIHYPLISEVALSPDGTQVVCAVREPLLSEERSEFITHLYLVSTDGGMPIQLTYGEHSNRCPKWSPDGQCIAFLSTRVGKANLYAMRAAGGEAWALTHYDKTNITQIAWSPDGQHIAFLMAEPPTEEKEKAQKAKNDPILWDVDFDFVHLFCVPFSVGPRTLPQIWQITRGRFHLLGIDWLPDGERLAIVHRPTPVDEDWPQTRLATVPARVPENKEGFGQDDLIDLGPIANWGDAPKASPDGAWIACRTGDQPVRWAFSSRIVLYPTTGGDPRPLAGTPDAQPYLLGWSTSGDEVLIFQVGGVNSQLWALPVSGAPAYRLTDSPSFKGPFDGNRQGRIVFAGQDFDQPNALYVLDRDTNDVRLILEPALPANWPEARLPKTEVIRWHADNGSKRSGIEIEGILTYPLDYRPGQRCPLIVEVHGGPTGVYGRQYLASSNRYCDIAGLAERGFCVLRANPRGSSGYGKDFRFANYGDWGGGDYRDIMAGVDFLIEQGIADPDRLGLLGWSYGGYMASWTITQTDRFKAACVGAGVTNLMSFNGTSDIAGFIPDYFTAEYWEQLEPYRQHSAMFQVKGVRTPTLIQHGQNDVRVPLSQGRELYNALKRQGVPVEMVIYPRQGHSIAEPRLRIDMMRRTTAWFERWVLGKSD